MQIIIKTAAVDITLEVEPSYTIRYVKDKIQEETSIHPNHQELVFSNEQLQDERTLSDYNIEEKSTIDFKLLVPSFEKTSEAMHSLKAFIDSHMTCANVSNVSSEIVQEAIIVLKAFADSNANSSVLIGDLCKANLSINERYQKLKTMYENVIRQNQQQTNEITQLRDDLNIVQTRLDNMTTEYQNLNTEHQNLTTAHQNLNTAHQNLNTEHQNLTTAHQNLNTAHQNLNTAHQNLTTAHQNLHASHQILLQKVEAFSEKSANWEKRLLELEKKK